MNTHKRVYQQKVRGKTVTVSHSGTYELRVDIDSAPPVFVQLNRPQTIFTLVSEAMKAESDQTGLFDSPKLELNK